MVLFNIRRKHAQGANARSIASAHIALDAASFPYTGEAVTPIPAITMAGEDLVVNEDYILSYEDNVNLGQARLVATGIGGFYGQCVKTFYIANSAPSPSGSWANFDLALTGAAASSGQLSDSDLSMYALQSVDDSMLCFMDVSSHRVYLWEFAAGHNFDPAHFASGYRSRSSAMNGSAVGAIISPDGMKVTYCGSTYSFGIHASDLSSSFDLSTMTEGSSLSTTSATSLALSPDGGTLATKIRNNNEVNLYSADTITYKNGVNLGGGYIPSAIPSGNMKDMSWSGDGLSFVVVYSDYVIRYTTTTPWDVSSPTAHSYFKPSGVSGIEAVAVNRAGTKMLLFSGSDKTFYLFNLLTA